MFVALIYSAGGLVLFLRPLDLDLFDLGSVFVFLQFLDLLRPHLFMLSFFLLLLFLHLLLFRSRKLLLQLLEESLLDSPRFELLQLLEGLLVDFSIVLSESLVHNRLTVLGELSGFEFVDFLLDSPRVDFVE